MKNNKGVITIEASVVLALFTFFILFFLGFGRLYCAQSVVSHAVLQAADAIGTESALREGSQEDIENRILFVVNHIYGGSQIRADAFESLENLNIANLAKQKFTSAVGKNSAETDETLKKYGVVDGLQGLNFSETSFNKNSGEVTVHVKYKVKLQFSLFGISEVQMTKTAKVKNLGEKMYIITAKSQNEKQGSASGSVKVKPNGETVISAFPYNGYAFDRWSDGNTQNPRKITGVNSNMTYVAIFKKDKFGITVKSNNSSWGTGNGSGNYELNSIAQISATPRDGFVFVGWSDDGDNTVDAGNQNPRSVLVRGDKTYIAVFKVEPWVAINTSGFSDSVFGDISSLSGRKDLEVQNNLRTSIQLSASTSVPGASIKWRSNNPSVATVNGSGLVSARGVGVASIYAEVSYEGRTYYAEARITNKIFVQSYYFRKNQYSNNVYKYGWYSPIRPDNWDKVFSSGPGWFYRYLLVDSYDYGSNVIYSGNTTKGKLNRADSKYNRYMHGTVATSAEIGNNIQTGYVLDYSGATSPYVYFLLNNRETYVMQSMSVANKQKR